MSTTVVIGVLVGLIIVGLTFTVFYLLSQVEQAKDAFIENPYCLLKTCRNDPVPEPGTLPATADKQRELYSTINWCMTNSPTRELEAKIRTCAAMTAADIEAYAKFYLEKYMPPCGYAWKTASDIPSRGGVINDNQTQASLNSSRDPFAASLIQCGTQMGMLHVVDYPSFNALFSQIQ